jgi:glycosyltransferase involved in cell wall biosynthesis
MEKVLSKTSNIHLVIGGEGILKEKLISLSKKLGLEHLIKFVGFIPDNKLPDYYRAADCFILPTKALEGFGLVTLESLASSTPVLGTPIGGTKEILEQFDPSFLFKDTTPNSMAELIMEKYDIIHHHPGQWKKISKKCRDFVEANYSWDKNVNTLEKLFLEMIRG